MENIHSGWLSSGKLVAPKVDNIQGRFNFFCHSLDLLTFSNTNGAKTLFWPRLLIRFPPFPVTQKRRPFYSRAAFSVRLTVHFFVVYHVSLCQALQGRNLSKSQKFRLNPDLKISKLKQSISLFKLSVTLYLLKSDLNFIYE